MQKQDWITIGVAALLPIQFVRGTDFQDAAFKRLDGWKKIFVGHTKISQ
jgi:hypothetical protein